MRRPAQRRAISLERAKSGCRILLTLLHLLLKAIATPSKEERSGSNIYVDGMHKRRSDGAIRT
jgi:hypothetical protein